MYILKVLNNNVVTSEEQGNELVLMGRGIAFGKKSGDVISEEMIEKRYVLSNQSKELLAEIPAEIMEISDKIIRFATENSDKVLTDKAFVAMADHIYGVVLRVREGVYLKNFLMWDIKRFFAEEFQVGLYANQLLSQYLGEELPIDEAGFMALTLVNAELDSGAAAARELTMLMEEILTIVKYSLEISLDAEDSYVERFMTHLKFFCERVLTQKSYSDLGDTAMFSLLQMNYPLAYETTQKIAEYLQKVRQYQMSIDEQMYVMIHLSRMTKKGNQK